MILSPPHRLVEGTPWYEAMPVLNEDFINLASSFRGFAVEDQLAFPDNSGVVTIGSGNLATGEFPVIASVQQAEVVTFFPRLSVYVLDTPPVLAPGATSYDDNYLFPTGASLTTDQKSLLVGQYRSLTGDVDPTFHFTGTDGGTYYYVGNVVFTLLNGGASSHTYYLTLNQSVYTRRNSFYQ